MSTRTENIKVTDKRGFHYEITLYYRPYLGFTNALYNGQIIGQVELGRIVEPQSDDEFDWERYEEKFAEWTDAIKVDIIPMCEEYFNNKK